jgi:hypothetical protein
MTSVPLKQAVAVHKSAPLDSDELQTARDLGITFGD